MFVFISMLISIAILGGLFFFAKQKESSLQRKYQLLVDLREVTLSLSSTSSSNPSRVDVWPRSSARN